MHLKPEGQGSCSLSLLRMQAIIDKDGNIKDLQLISRHPMLVPSAIAAVKQWRYKPYLLNGNAVGVETTITVIFTLAT